MMYIWVRRAPEEKQETRALYERVFPEDSPRFLDWYYADRCRDNIVLELQKDERIVAMLHLNPFIMRTKSGTEAKVYYIYAVATAPEERHQGFMSALLERSFLLMEEEQVPFCFLLPVDEAIYEPFDFHRVCRFQTKKCPDYTTVQRTYDIYIEETPEYLQRVQAEQAIAEAEGGNLEDELPANPVIMARILSLKAFQRFSGLPESTNRQQAMQWLKKQNIYISAAV